MEAAEKEEEGDKGGDEDEDEGEEGRELDTASQCRIRLFACDFRRPVAPPSLFERHARQPFCSREGARGRLRFLLFATKAPILDPPSPPTIHLFADLRKITSS